MRERVASEKGLQQLSARASVQTGAVVFPGQGSQHAGMQSLVEQECPHLLDQVCSHLGDNPFEMLDQGTMYIQPAVFCASLAAWRRVEASVEPAAFAGHSMGELAALVAAGAIDEEDALELVCVRARTTHALARERAGGMVVIRADIDTASELAAVCGLAVANHNSPRQVVLSGVLSALEAAQEQAKAQGIRVRRLDVDGAFHSPAMAAAVPAYRAALERARFVEPSAPVYSSATGEPFIDVRAELANGLVTAVRWVAVVQALQALGLRYFVEPGPGRVLCGLIERILDDAVTWSGEDDVDVVTQRTGEPATRAGGQR